MGFMKSIGWFASKKKGRSSSKNKSEKKVDPESNAEPQEVFIGSIVSVSAQEISGWAVSKYNPEKGVNLEIWMDDQVVGETTANGIVGEVEEDNMRRLCEFRWPVTPDLLDGRVHEFSVRVQVAGSVLPGSGLKVFLPLVDELESSVPDRAGNLAVSGKWISGWAVDKNISDPLHVTLTIDGVTLGRMLAGQYGPQLEGYPFENKNTCFIFPAPELLFDGFKHKIQVAVEEWGDQQIPKMTSDFAGGDVLGFVDNYKSGGVTGWVGFRKIPPEFIPVTVFLDGIPLSQARLTDMRPDVVNAGLCNAAYKFNAVFSLPKKGSLEVRYGEYSLRNSRHECRPGKDCRGNIDIVSHETISGWALDVNNPSDQVELALIIDGRTYTKFKPSVPRADVCKLFSGATACGFKLPTPEILLDGESHVVGVWVAETGQKLQRGGKDEVTCHFPITFERIPSTNLHPVLSTFIPQIDSSDEVGIPKMKPDVSLIVLNRNGEDILGALFESFLATNHYPSYEFVVVDHASSDKSIEVIDAWAKRLTIKTVCLDYNGSFAASNNLAARDYAQGDVLLCLNNDIVFVQDILTEMMAQLKADEKVGMIGIKLLDIVEDQGMNFNPPVQHLGIRFKLFENARILPYDEKLSPNTAHTCYRPVASAGVTGAVMMVRRNEFLSVGGFHEEYFYGYEDVDLCLQYRIKLGKEIVCLNNIQALHHRGYSRLSGREMGVFDGLDRNHDVLLKRFGYAISRLHRESVFNLDGIYASKLLRIAFAVTETGENATAGDYFTALEIARELNKYPHVEPVFLSERNDWYCLENIQVLVVMRHDYDLRCMRKASGDLVTVAWLRNHFETWEKQQWFQDFDLYASSSLRHVTSLTNSGIPCRLLPIATTPEVMSLGQPHEDFSCEVAFNGSAWAVKRDAATAIELLAEKGVNTAVFGSGWSATELAQSYRGFVSYSRMPEVYASSLIVLDDANPSAREWGSANSRVFDAISAGCLVLTNSRAASEDFFDGLLPVWDTPEEATALAESFLKNTGQREALITNLQQIVHERHTYAKRANDLMEMLGNYAVKSLRIAIKTPVPNHKEKPWWGDWHFAESLASALKAQGHSVRIDILPEWDSARKKHVDDVVIVLRGLSEYKPSPEQINIMWLISHPEKVTVAEMKQFNHVFVASEKYTQQLQALGVSASTLLQCADAKRMRPPSCVDSIDQKEDIVPYDHLFVGNSRGERRKIVDDLIQLGVDVAIYGREWFGLVPEKFLKGECIANRDLHEYYGRAGIVYNDHWPDMAANGFLSNRLFDAAACGAYVVSDFIEGLEDTFEGLIPGCRNKEELTSAINAAANGEYRKKIGDALRTLVLEKHTFNHRANTLIEFMLEEDAAHTGRARKL